MDARKTRWGVDQWAAYFENQALPVMLRSKQILTALEAASGDRMSPKELSDIVLLDPLLCLCLLRQAERKRSRRLEKPTTTALAAIMQLGVDDVRSLLLSSPEIESSNMGLLEVEARATTAAQIALRWAAGRLDLNPEEVAVATLLADAGELLLWVYEPDIAQAVKDELRSGRCSRSAEAQMQACGFGFKFLTLRCAEQWKLPALMVQLLRGADSVRAQITGVASDAARHVVETFETSDQALACNIAEARRLMPAVSLEWLLDGLVMVPEEKKPRLLALAAAELVRKPEG